MSKTLTIGQDRIRPTIATYVGDRDLLLDAVTNDAGQRGLNPFRPGGKSEGKVKITLELCPTEFLELMLETAVLTTKMRLDLLAFVGGGGGADWSEEMATPSDVVNFIYRLGVRSMNVEVLVAGRWYPVTLKGEAHNIGEGRGKFAVLQWKALIGDNKYGDAFAFFPDDFEREDDRVTFTARDLLARHNVREIETDLADHADAVYEASQLGHRVGSVCVATGTVLEAVRVKSVWSSQVQTQWNSLVIEESSARVVTDPDLEAHREENKSNTYWWQQRAQEDADPLPFVRCFNLTTKRWIYADVRSLSPYEFDRSAAERLVLPEEMRSIMMQLFEAETSTLAGDVIAGKHGGMIILANGPTGTGKTLTAEVCAEYTQRPLYVMEMAELGVDVNQAEQRLEKIFQRVTRWNAVLLMDECDIFLQERRSDLTHNVMVGIFLRLMDYYHGLMFLTSNRGDVIDEAFASRITLRFDYERLDRDARERVWNILLDSAAVTVTDGLDGVPDAVLNGRQIRNLVRLVHVLHGDRVTNEQVKRVIEFSPSSTN